MISFDRTAELSNIPIADNINEYSSLKLSDYAVNVEYIPLETTSDELLTGNERIARQTHESLINSHGEINKGFGSGV